MRSICPLALMKFADRVSIKASQLLLHVGWRGVPNPRFDRLASRCLITLAKLG